MFDAIRGLSGLLLGTALFGAGVPACAAGSSPPALSFTPTATPVPSILPTAEAQPQTEPPQGSTARIEPPRGRVCFDPAETREKIAAHKLAEPFRALRMGRLQGEALRAKLCRWKPDEFVYEIAILRRDGRVVHLYMNALNGQSVGVLSEVDRH